MTAATLDRPASITIGTFGSDSKVVDFVPDFTAGDYVAAAGLKLGGATDVILVGETQVTADTPVEPGVVVQLVAKVANG